jgi:hypothetical protein
MDEFKSIVVLDEQSVYPRHPLYFLQGLGINMDESQSLYLMSNPFTPQIRCTVFVNPRN